MILLLLTTTITTTTTTNDDDDDGDENDRKLQWNFGLLKKFVFERLACQALPLRLNVSFH